MPTLLVPSQCFLLGTSTITGGAEDSFHLSGQYLPFFFFGIIERDDNEAWEEAAVYVQDEYFSKWAMG